MADQPGNGRTIKKCPGKPPETPVKIRISVFFDGTLNNRKNTELRQAGKGGRASVWGLKNWYGSYTNDYSNVAKLEWALGETAPGYDFAQKVYIEGIGTEDGQSDSAIYAGASRGKGGTGVEAKVKIGLAKVLEKVMEFVSADVPITYIHLDSFGFSRGAAAARSFIYKAISSGPDRLKERLEAKGYAVGEVRMRFVGLFDTVASLGVNHDDNTAELHLDAVENAEKVVQLAAAEEHRKNFRLTNIKSAGTNGTQIFLPGVHSDVGGGYVDGEGDEVQIFDIDSTWNSKAQKAAIERERAWVIEQGWYGSGELQKTDFWNEVVGKRESILNTYALIPLHLMAEFAQELGLLFTTVQAKHPIPPALDSVNGMIKKYVTSTQGATAHDWFNKVTPELKELRHKYLHFSASYGSTAGANSPQWAADDPVNGWRTRVIQNG
jgi:hypothetical protein